MKNFIDRTILYFFPSGNNKINWQYHHFVRELEMLNIKFDLFNPLEYGENFEEELIKKVKREKDKLSLFITASYDGEISIPTLKEIKSTGLPTVLICYDNISIPFVHKKTARYYDLVWLTSRETENLFKTWGANTIFLPYAANPFIFKPSALKTKRNNTIGFIGSCYGNRPRILNLLARDRIQTEVFTNHENNTRINQPALKKYLKNLGHSIYYFSNLLQFPIGRQCIKGAVLKNFMDHEELKMSGSDYLAVNNSVDFDQMIDLYSSFAITLNIIDLLDTFVLKQVITKIHLRVFEVPMCGGLQITRRTGEIQEYFREDTEILLYDSEEELIDKTKYYLSADRDATRTAMKINARMRAASEHTWTLRFTNLHHNIFGRV